MRIKDQSDQICPDINSNLSPIKPCLRVGFESFQKAATLLLGATNMFRELICAFAVQFVDMTTRQKCVGYRGLDGQKGGRTNKQSTATCQHVNN